MNFYTNYVTRTIPIGGVVPIPLYFDNYNIDIDTMFLDCNGAEIFISDYRQLYNILGTDYGGDGIDTFALPDYQGVFLSHEDGVSVIGDYVADTIIDHIHQITNYKNDTAGDYKGVVATQNRTSGYWYYSSGYPMYSNGTAWVYYSESQETRPKNIYARYCVRYR